MIRFRLPLPSVFALVLLLMPGGVRCVAADRIVFDRLGPTQGTLYLSNADGSGERPLTQPGTLDYNPSWSPKGDWIVFTSDRESDFRPAKDRWERLLFTSSRMGFKDEVLLISAPQPYGEIFVMRYDGTEVEQLTDDQWEEGAPAWQPHRSGLEATAAAAR